MPFVIRYLEVLVCKLSACKISVFKLVAVAKQAGLSLTQFEAPKTGFLVTRPKYMNHITRRSGLEFVKLFSCSTQLSTKFILLINVKMPTIVGILTFINMINTTSERLKSRNFFICRYFSFYEQLKFRAQLS